MAIQPLRRGFILHRRDFRNSSLLLEVFGADDGRLAVVAKGAKTPARGRTAQASLLQPFQPLWLSWVGRGEVKTLTRAEPAGEALPLVGERLFCGLYLNELLMRLLERDDPHAALFVFYQQALADLRDGAVETVLRRFELRLLEELGYAPDLTRDRGGSPIDLDGCYRYLSGEGLVRIASDRAHPADAAAQGPLIGGRSLKLLVDGAPLSGTEARETRALLRAALAPYIGTKPLKSRELFRRRKI
jgi:DNA repair protein RecO (recombination protein O)